MFGTKCLTTNPTIKYKKTNEQNPKYLNCNREIESNQRFGNMAH